MSRFVSGFDGAVVDVTADTNGVPLCVNDAPVVQVLSHHREWIGVLEGEPQRDVWRVQAGRRLCELHRLTYPAGDEEAAETVEPQAMVWRLMRWED